MQEDINAIFFCVKIILTASRENAHCGCFDHLFSFVLLNICPGHILEPQRYGTSLFQQCLYLRGSNEIMQQGAGGLFCFVNIIGCQTCFLATVLKLKITLTRASRSCLHIDI